MCFCFVELFRFGTKTEVEIIISELALLSTTSEAIQRIQTFVNENDLDVNGYIGEALKNAKINLQWANTHIPTIEKIIKQMLGNIET